MSRSSGCWWFVLFTAVVLIACAPVHADNNKKGNSNPAPPPQKAAPAARPAPPPQQRPQGGTQPGGVHAPGGTNGAGGVHGPGGTNGTGGVHAPGGTNGAGGVRGPGGTNGAGGVHGHGGPVPAGTITSTTKTGGVIQKRPNGQTSYVHNERLGMDIRHGRNGGTAVDVRRKDGTRIYAERGRPGFVERPYGFHGHDYARRTYYYQGRAYDRYYRSYYYRGVYVNVYVPVRYYPVGFYGWAYNPWYQPVVYSWGWGPAPWYGYYGGYFAPYPAYPTAASWLTDYMISADLQAQYQANQEAQTAAAPVPQNTDVALTPQVKQMISDEVRSQLNLEYNEAQQNAQNQEPDPGSSGIDRMFRDGQTHVFVAAGSMDVVDASGVECSLTPGDVLKLKATPAQEVQNAEMIVLASKGGAECAKDAEVSVALSDVQEMQNHMRESIDQGLAELQTNAGKKGLPAAPPSAHQPSATAPYAQLAPPPAPTDADQINQQLKDADAAEKEVTAEPQRNTGAAMAAPTVPRSFCGTGTHRLPRAPIAAFDQGASGSAMH